MKNEDQDRRLEQALQRWEDKAFLDYLVRRSAEPWPDHELLLQEVSPFSLEEIAGVRGRLLQSVTNSVGHGLLQKESFPEGDPMSTVGLLWGLYGWCQSSRRNYRVPGDLQLLLQATSLRGLWDGMKLPFHAFAIHLEEPLETEEHGAFDVILFHMHGEERNPSCSMNLLSRSHRSYEPISQRDRSRMLRALRQRDSSKFARQMSRELAKPQPVVQTFRFETIPLEDVPLGTPEVNSGIDSILHGIESQYLEHGHGELGRFVVTAMRLVFGLAFYLQSLSSTRNPVSGNPKPPPHPSLSRLITQGAEVCHVQNLHVLNEEEREALREHVSRIGREASPHFREGYYSRPPGKGQDPTATKTVWHRPTIVRRDLVPNGALPVGSKSVIRR